MNEKLIKVAKREGFCCMWAFLQAYRTARTGDLVTIAKHQDVSITVRAVRYQRRAFRAGDTVCEKLPTCLRAQLRASGKIL